MSKHKLIFFDIDGTLLDHQKELPTSTKSAIQKLKEAGHKVAIATGRAPFMFKELREELKINTFISYNGQYAILDGKLLYKNPLNRDAVQRLTDLANNNQHPVIYMDHERMNSNVESHPHVTESIESLKLKFNHLGYNPNYFLEKELYQLHLLCPEDAQSRYEEDFKEFSFIRWHELSTDVLPDGGSKAKGIEKVMEALKFSREDVYAFGDGLNDVEMLQFVGHGVAMGNAEESVKKFAKHVTKKVDEDGILFGLKMLGLLQ